MHWKLKAGIQNAIAALPSPVSYAAYYRMQRLFGGLARPDAVEPLSAGVATWTRILDRGMDPADKVFFEVGTGRAPFTPLAFWLMGARRTITVDINPYLKSEILRAGVEYIVANLPAVTKLFGGLLQQERMARLVQWYTTESFSLERCLALCGIDYRSPADAARTGLPSHSVDFHTSYTVFEHIPHDTLLQILREGNRITRADGLFVHMIDYSDHFSHSDPGISSINFLQYSDVEWARLAGNRYMYMNRLRHDDLIKLFEDAGHNLVDTRVTVDKKALELLDSGLVRLEERFGRKSRDVLGIRDAWIVSQQAPAVHVPRVLTTVPSPSRVNA
jgi:hypothetical protein